MARTSSPGATSLLSTRILGEDRRKLVPREVHFLQLLIPAPVLVLLGHAQIGREPPAAVVVPAGTDHPELVEHVVRLKERVGLPLRRLGLRFFLLGRSESPEEEERDAGRKQADCQAFGIVEVAGHKGISPFAGG